MILTVINTNWLKYWEVCYCRVGFTEFRIGTTYPNEKHVYVVG
jgi:hypothetical protein